MRSVIFAINITLDGCCDHTKTIGDDEILEHYTQLMQEVDLQVFGRKTYQLMVPFWSNDREKTILLMESNARANSTDAVVSDGFFATSGQKGTIN